MMIIAIISCLVWLVAAVVVAGDMFKKKTALGCLGLFLLPLVPFVWVLKWYGGKRKVMVPVLYGSFLIAVAAFLIGWNTTSTELKPFIESARRTAAVECFLSSIQFKEGESRVVLTAEVPEHFGTEDYGTVDEMIRLYREKYIDPIAGGYPEVYKEGDRKVIIVAVPTPSGFTVCYRIVSPGKVAGAWASPGNGI